MFNQKRKDSNILLSRKQGFTLIEILVVIALIGSLALILYPSIMNSLETRALENQTRDILATLERAKFGAVNLKLNHRVRFFYEGTSWYYVIEKEDILGNWTILPDFIRKRLSNTLNISVNFPAVMSGSGQSVNFSPLGIITNYSINLDTIVLQSDRLKGYNQPDQRIIRVYLGGSLKYIKSQSG
jgi:prepilin-type N-terminal cleavage/methylation domain-containing protein